MSTSTHPSLLFLSISILAAALRLFDSPLTNPALAATVMNAPAHRALAQTAAEESIVLLKNANSLLPLSPTVARTIAVVGPNGGCGNSGSGAGTVPLCDAQQAMMGNYVETATDVPPVGVPTIVESIRSVMSGATVTFNRGCNIDDAAGTLLPAALAAARAADVVVAVLGDSTRSSAEGGVSVRNQNSNSSRCVDCYRRILCSSIFIHSENTAATENGVS